MNSQTLQSFDNQGKILWCHRVVLRTSEPHRCEPVRFSAGVWWRALTRRFLPAPINYWSVPGTPRGGSLERLIGVIMEPGALPFSRRAAMTKELSVQRELNYAPCHTVTVNLMGTESKINKLSKAADALLSTLLRWYYMVLLNTTRHKRSSWRLRSRLHIRINPCKIPLDLPPLICCLGCAQEWHKSAHSWSSLER